jgi:hypothetical protein
MDKDAFFEEIETMTGVVEKQSPAKRAKVAQTEPDEAEFSRMPREADARETNQRVKSWQVPSLLPEPDKQPGYEYRWVRVSTLSQPDARNVSSRLREGWEMVRAEEQPQLALFSDRNAQFSDSIEIGGLVLCKIPSEFVQQRKDYFRNRNKEQIKSVDYNFMKNSDPRMPLFSERKSKVTFGDGN